MERIRPQFLFRLPTGVFLRSIKHVDTILKRRLDYLLYRSMISDVRSTANEARATADLDRISFDSASNRQPFRKQAAQISMGGQIRD